MGMATTSTPSAVLTQAISYEMRNIRKFTRITGEIAACQSSNACSSRCLRTDWIDSRSSAARRLSFEPRINACTRFGSNERLSQVTVNST